MADHIAGAEHGLAEIDRIIQQLTNELATARAQLARAEAPQFMSVAAAARYLGVSRTVIYELIDGGSLHRHANIAGSQARLKKSELDAFVDGRTSSSTDRLAS